MGACKIYLVRLKPLLRYDPSHTYKFVDIENQGCKFIAGCTIIVKLESTSSADKINVLINKGRLVPIARLK